MKYSHDVDYKRLWERLEEWLNQKMDDFDWEGDTATDAAAQAEAYASKEMCCQILDLMDSLHQNAMK